MTAKEVAELLNVNVRTIQLWAANGTLPSYRIGRLLRFQRGEIQQKIVELRRD
jgi:excisionase family DNA binding protein